MKVSLPMQVSGPTVLLSSLSVGDTFTQGINQPVFMVANNDPGSVPWTLPAGSVAYIDLAAATVHSNLGSTQVIEVPYLAQPAA
jgi:hypothetical protein